MQIKDFTEGNLRIMVLKIIVGKSLDVNLTSVLVVNDTQKTYTDSGFEPSS